MLDLESDCYQFWENLDWRGQGRTTQSTRPGAGAAESRLQQGSRKRSEFSRIKSLGQLDAESDGLTLGKS